MRLKFLVILVFASALSLTIYSCGDSTSSTECTLDDNTTAGTTSTNGCSLVTRDTSSCESSRTAQGLSGHWLKFSCRVTLTVSGTNVVITSDGQPDHKSAYFATTHACYEAGFPDGRAANVNTLGEQSMSMTVPLTPTASTANTTTTAMSMGTIGLAINGVSIFSNAAAPGDDIYSEVATFDKCEGHPAGTKYHYHTEPTTTTNSDSNFVGVLIDGIPIYGRLDADGSTPTLDTTGGHTGTTPDSTTAVYHYHVNLQTSGADSAYFITSGYHAAALGSCTGCN